MQIVSAFFLIRPFHKLRSRSQGGESMCCFQSAGNTGHMARETDEGKKNLSWYCTKPCCPQSSCSVETWPLTEEAKRKLEIETGVLHLSDMWFFSLGNKVISGHLREVWGSVHREHRYQRLRWLGRVVRMGPQRLPIQVLLGWIEGKRPRGRSRRT